ncbi:MAG TPA: HAD family phosphatase, partial [Ktedonobacteraceae bacterium]
MLQSTINNLVIFDLDGVITSEEAYWDTAGLVVHELLYSPQYWHIDPSVDHYLPAQSAEESRRLSRQILPETLILDLKARSVNSNWDTCYAGFSLYLIELLAQLPARASLLPLRPWDATWIAAFRQQLAELPTPARPDVSSTRPFHSHVFQGYSGLALIERLNAYASERLELPIEEVFARYSPSWHFCEELFQEWYLGEALYRSESGHAPKQPQKPGCIHFEEPLLPIDRLRSTLETLRDRGYTLGVATGRPGAEAIAPLKQYGLFPYFSEEHVVSHAEVAQAEERARAQGNPLSLVKPHPYQFLRAADPTYQPGQPTFPRGSFIVVGDTPSDVRGGQAAGALVLAVLSGARTPEARTLLEESEPDFLLTDMTEVPALLERIDDLATIQRLQFTERARAELLLQRWFMRFMRLETEQVTLAPKAVSLNSFNGIYRADGEEYFFKTHVEEQGVLEEYYNATMLHDAGYNIVRPVRSLHEKGQQMVVYPVIHFPVMFDLMRAVETGHTEEANVEILAAAEKGECDRLNTIYRQSLAPSTAEEHARAPIHQLFWHRLTGERYKSFYAGKSLSLPAP